MPVSYKENKEKFVEWYKKIDPRFFVLDIGPGVGTYARLIPAVVRQDARWIGIEVWAPYIEEYELRALYDDIVVADARFVDWHKFNPVELIIAGDVLEHMDKEDAVMLVTAWKQITQNIIVSIPIVDIHQHLKEGNTYESHLHQWRFEEILPLFSDGLVDSVKGENLGYFWWRSPFAPPLPKRDLE